MEKCHWCGKIYENYPFSRGYCSNKCRYERDKNNPSSSSQTFKKLFKQITMVFGAVSWIMGWFLIYNKSYLLGVGALIVGSTIISVTKAGIKNWIMENL